MALLCLLAALGAIVYYIFVPGKAEFTSDCADTLLWAQASAESGKVLNPDFGYASLLPFGGQLVMWPFVAAFGLTHTAHALGMLAFVLLLAAALVFCLRSLGLRWPAALLSCAMVLLGLTSSAKMRELFFNHILYYSLGLVFFATTIGLIARLLTAKNTRPWLMALGLFTLLVGTNSFTGLALCVVPCFAGLALHQLLSRRPLKDDPRALCALGAMALCAAGGCLLRGALWPNMRAAYENAYSSFSSATDWITHLQGLFDGWFSLFGVGNADGLYSVNLEGVMFASPAGADALARMALAVMVLLLPALGLARIRQLPSRMLKVLVLSHWTMAALVLFAYVFGQLGYIYWRLCPILASSLLVSAALIATWLRGRSLPVKRVAAIACAVLALYGAERAAHLYTLPATSAQLTNINRLIAFLTEKELYYGYSTQFWVANSTTVLSGESVCVRPVYFEDGQPLSSAYQSNANWYGEQPGVERYFLMVDSATLASGAQAPDGAVAVYPFNAGTGWLGAGTYMIYAYEQSPVAGY